MPRPFRNPESFDEEQKTRGALKPFLASCGFTNIHERQERRGNAVVQIVRSIDDNGSPVEMGARLCWRKRFGKSDEGFAAFQLLFKVKSGVARDSIRSKLDREKERGRTHWLIVNRDELGITNAVMIPIREVLPIWERQREIYDRLIRKGKLGSRKSNPAENGASPALYVQDDRAKEAVGFVFAYPGVRNLVPLADSRHADDDTFDDLPNQDPFQFGSDGAPREKRMVSGVKRDPAVRRMVILRARGKCERCGARRSYAGFLDVHHIFGAETSDRVWNCVALCPNCHRDAHFSHDRGAINTALLDVAGKNARGNGPSATNDARTGAP